MDLALIVLAAAVVLAALILALVRPETVAREPAAADPRLDTLLTKQGEIGGPFTQTVEEPETLTRTLGESRAAIDEIQHAEHQDRW